MTDPIQATLLQRAYRLKAGDMSSGSCITPKFSANLQDFADAAQMLSERVPLLRGRVKGKQIVFADKVVSGKGNVVDYIHRETCAKIVEDDEGFNFMFSHDVLDGWSWMVMCMEIWRIAEGGALRDNYQWGRKPDRINADGPDQVKFRPFIGIRGEAIDFVVDVDDTYRHKAKALGVRVQELLATAFSRALGNANIITTKMMPGFERDIGHYSMYGVGSLDENGFYQLDCSYENFTRMIMYHGLGEMNGTAFVSSFPTGQGTERINPVGHKQFLCANQMGRAQLTTGDSFGRLRIQLNQGIKNPEQVAEDTISFMTQMEVPQWHSGN